MANILIVDDDKAICESLADFIKPMGHNVAYVFRLKEGMEKINTAAFDLVFLDVRLPDGSGLEKLPTIREAASSPEVIIITGEGDPDGAELAIKSGCWDYIQKPLSPKKVALSLKQVLQYREEKTRKKPPLVLKREGIIGHSARLQHYLEIVAKAATTDANVLITGSTGTGKELFARAIHENSPRSDEAFVVVDCAALPQTLIESMLFGHQKGAFTGADKSRQGLIKEADGGTLFLDEVAELPMTVQGTFLRVFQERRFRPVGSRHEYRRDFRLISATNRDISQMAQTGTFRNDLLFRLRAIVIDLPPLRDRTEDIKDLAFHYMAKFCDRFGIGTKGFSPEFLEALMNYSWPGNVRELITAIERVLTIARDEHTLFPIHLPTHIRSQLARASVEPSRFNKLSPEKDSVNSIQFSF